MNQSLVMLFGIAILTGVTGAPASGATRPSCTIGADKDRVSYGATIGINWDSSTDVTWASLAQEKSSGFVSVAKKGSLQTSPLLAATVFKLRVRNKNGLMTQCLKRVEVTPPARLVILGAGQSNMARYFVNAGTKALPFVGSQYLESRLPAVDRSVESVLALNAASGGSSLLSFNKGSKNEGKNYWLEYDEKTQTFSPGPLLKNAVRLIQHQTSVARPVNYILWAQGEQDAAKIEERSLGSARLAPLQREQLFRSQMELYRKGLVYLCLRLRDAGGSSHLPIGIQGLGQRNMDFVQSGPTKVPVLTHVGIHAIRQIQLAVARDLPNLAVLAPAYDASLEDSAHMDKDGQRMVLDRIIRNMARQRSGAAILTGPRISLVDRLPGNVLRVQFTTTSLKVGAEAAKLFSVHAPSGQLLLRAVSVKKISSQVVDVSFGSPVPKGAKLITAFGNIGLDQTPHWNFEASGRYVYDKYGFPMAPMEIQVPD